MTIAVTPDQLAAMQPCNLDRRLALFGRRKSLNAKQALKAGVSIRDILWVAGRLGHKDKIVRFALLVAQRAARFTSDPRVQASLDATEAYIADPSPVNLEALRVARRAASAYAYAADAADAAYAAAYASYAYAYAADAAYAAAYAAYAGAYAGDAAYAARQDEVKAQEAILIEIFGS